LVRFLEWRAKGGFFFFPFSFFFFLKGTIPFFQPWQILGWKNHQLYFVLAPLLGIQTPASAFKPCHFDETEFGLAPVALEVPERRYSRGFGGRYSAFWVFGLHSPRLLGNHFAAPGIGWLSLAGGRGGTGSFRFPQARGGVHLEPMVGPELLRGGIGNGKGNVIFESGATPCLGGTTVIIVLSRGQTETRCEVYCFRQQSGPISDIAFFIPQRLVQKAGKGSGRGREKHL